MKNNIIMPNYEHSILNTITSILKYYGVKSNHNSLESLDKFLETKHRNVVLLILDGMGEHILNKLSPNGFLVNHKIDLVTSVYPSTTTAALTTYYSGKPPYESGWIAWSQYFKEYGRAIDMLSYKESYKGDSIADARINVFKELVNYESVFSKIEKASNIPAYEIMPSYSDRRSNRTIKADSVDEILDNIKMLCEVPNEKFILAYCDNPDGILHKYGSSSNEAKEFIQNTENKIQELCSKLDDDTILIISADHGHKDIENVYTLLDYPKIQECLIMPPSLESRSLTFWVKENMRNVFEDEFNKIFGNEFWLMTKEEFLDKHFLGFGIKHPKIDDFLGNYIALSTNSSIIRLETYLAEGKKVKKSTHCGLSKEEMEVPLIVI
jgi:hypothetical protein